MATFPEEEREERMRGAEGEEGEEDEEGEERREGEMCKARRWTKGRRVRVERRRDMLDGADGERTVRAIAAKAGL
jgi:hypothetical protein